jgi:hypothetical protein
MGISEQATAAQAPAFTDAAQQHGVDRGRAESSERQGGDGNRSARARAAASTRTFQRRRTSLS